MRGPEVVFPLVPAKAGGCPGNGLKGFKRLRFFVPSLTRSKMQETRIRQAFAKTLQIFPGQPCTKVGTQFFGKEPGFPLSRE